MKRVMIIGSPGTGKSVFARKLAAKTQLPLIHLDYYYHDSSKNYDHDKLAWRSKVESMIGQESWIIDGNYGATMSDRMKIADTILFFDLPRRTAVLGVVRRWFSGKRTDMPEDWKETPSWAFLKYVWQFRAKYRADTVQLLDENKDKTIVIYHSRTDASKYLQLL